MIQLTSGYEVGILELEKRAFFIKNDKKLPT